MEVTAAYAEKHGVFQLFEGLLQSLIVTKPDDPIAHLIDLVSAPPKDTAQASKAPKGMPRLLLLGGPASGAEEVAAAAARRYGTVHVSASLLLQAAASRGTAASRALLPYMAANVSEVPSECLGPLVVDRLRSDDVRRRGFLLTGFPNNEAQCEFLERAGIWVRSTLLLDIDEAAAAHALIASRVDPVTGTEYHPDQVAWPTDPAVLERLVQHPSRAEAQVLASLQSWRASKAQLLAAFPDHIIVDASRPSLALEERLGAILLGKGVGP